ncbi:phosphoribosylanthranilate isomerase [Parabacteroides sp. PF5-9]|uniref:phosphoribosylanthranilate isomerase n=1 Tax=Parabacteroides sp. PF5-9 TaxID=1742404 RepID=UPI002474672C|nr:phosphoribosylanthranilate isomerase [Parabacteroides sp. PF5-9]MDH6356622.1 phosphoribosylanthranilate isomerase [Parabacteroides sp. PF5-9]
MIIKVCGMRDPENILQVAQLGINWMGFIFYPQSPRYALSKEDGQSFFQLTQEKSNFRKVGVFVDATVEQMIEMADKYKLDYLQLHGNESPEICQTLYNRGISLIKTSPIASINDMQATLPYEGYVDYFLFDTQCEQYGGSGKQFDWSVLSAYTGKTPFILSGGITPDSAEAIRQFHHPQFAGIDLNSGFEIEPGLKNSSLLHTFLKKIKVK